MPISSAHAVIGFILTLLLFLAVNLLAAHLQSDCGLPAFFNLSGCADDIRRAGFPLQFYEEGGFDGHSSFDFTGARSADIASAGWRSAPVGGLQVQRLWKQKKLSANCFML